MPANRDQPAVPLRAITGDENILLLAPRPGDESLLCGGLVAEACARGRPPYIAILTDGGSCDIAGWATPAERAAAWERAARRATAGLGLPDGRLLMVGLYDGTVPGAGPAFSALVKALALVMWARDCNVVCVPRPDATADRLAAAAVAAALSDELGVPLIVAGTSGGFGQRLDTRPHRAALRAAACRYPETSARGTSADPPTFEVYEKRAKP